MYSASDTDFVGSSGHEGDHARWQRLHNKMVTVHPQGSNFTTATTANAVTSSAFAVMPFKFGLYWWHHNAVPFSPFALVPSLVNGDFIYRQQGLY